MKAKLTHLSSLRPLQRETGCRNHLDCGRHLPIGLLVLALCLGLTAKAAVIPGLFNTGVDNTHAPFTTKNFDPHYTFLTGSPILGTPMTATSADGFPIPPWLADNQFSTWISPTTNTVAPGATDGSAIYLYQTEFDLTGLDPATAVVSGQWATDNRGIDILINGAGTGQANTSQFAAWTSFQITNGFVRGTNFLTFVVNNGEGETPPDGPSGLRVEMTGKASEAPPIPGLFNTGVDATGKPQADDAGELHYALAGPSAVVGTPFVATSTGGFPIGPWLADNSVSAWIGPSPTTVGPNEPNGAANYYYETRFDLAGRDPTTAVIEGQWATDNDGIDILINGLGTAQPNLSGFTSWMPFRIDHGFVPGINTLTFVMNNGAGDKLPSGPTGLRVELHGSALPICVDFQTFLPVTLPNPWAYGGIQFIARDHAGGLFTSPGIRRDGVFVGLNCGGQLEITLPSPCNSVDVTLVQFTPSPAIVTAFNASGATVATALTSGLQSVAETRTLNGLGIARIVIVAPSYETSLLGLCCRLEMPSPLSIGTITKKGGTVTLTWRSVRGKPYRVQFKANLNAGSWATLAGDVTGNGATVSKVDATIGNAARRFYRLIEAPSAPASGNP